MSRLRFRRPPLALVIAVVALFVGLGGGAYAAKKINTGDIKNRAVTAKKIDRRAVRPPKIANQAVRTKKIQIGAVTSSRLLHPTFWAYLVGNPPSIARSNGALTVSRVGAGDYRVGFDPDEVAEAADIDLTDCAYQVTPSVPGPGREAQVNVDPGNAFGVTVRIRNSGGALVDSDYSVAVFC